MILEGDIEVKSMTAVQEPQANKGMTALVFNPDNKVTARVSDAFNASLVFLVGADSKELPCFAVLEADKTFLALGNDSEAATPEGFVDIAPIGSSVAAT